MRTPPKVFSHYGLTQEEAQKPAQPNLIQALFQFKVHYSSLILLPMGITSLFGIKLQGRIATTTSKQPTTYNFQPTTSNYLSNKNCHLNMLTWQQCHLGMPTWKPPHLIFQIGMPHGLHAFHIQMATKSCNLPPSSPNNSPCNPLGSLKFQNMGRFIKGPLHHPL